MEDMLIYVSESVRRTESPLGLSYLDFEPGDNFYWTIPFGECKFGTIISSEAGKIVVLSDETGELIEFTDTPEQTLEKRLESCGKPMDYSYLHVGSVISQLLSDGIRRYVRVTKYVPGMILEGDYSNPDYGKFKAKAWKNSPVEHLLAEWELED